jgi:hypothetical protein
MSERDPTIIGNDVPRGEGDPAVIRAEIHETRERLGETIEEIGERLNPNRLKEQVKDNIRDATIGRVETMAHQAVERVDQTRRTFMNTIRENPIPAAMVGVGLGWLLWNQRQQGSFTSSSRYGARTQPGRGDVSSRAYAAGGTEFAGPYAEPSAAFAESREPRAESAGLTETVKETAEQLADRAQNVAGTVAQQTRTQTRRVQEQFEENPLAIGTATLALGLAAGLAIPATRREAELVGDARDRFVDRVRNVARDTADKVQNVAERVIDETQATTGRQGAREENLTY